MANVAIAPTDRCGLPPLAFDRYADRAREEQRSSAVSVITRGRALFWQGDHQAQKIEIVEGVVRAVRLIENGNRQILAFYWPGDVVMPTRTSCQQFTAEAVTNCRVRFSTVSGTCHQGAPCGAHQVLSETLSLVLTMGQKNIIERVAWFLLRIRRRLPEEPKWPRAFRLMIPRADIADHLGTSLETVCRTLADFRSKGLIDLPNRKTIRFINLQGLSQVAGD